MSIPPGSIVNHVKFGEGKVISSFGDMVVVDFFGYKKDVQADSLTVIKSDKTIVIDRTQEDQSHNKLAFRKSFEAINLGVVPPDPAQLLDLTIRSDELKKKVSTWLKGAHQQGLCKVVFGYYGSGKSHMLKFIRCMALQAGWAVAYLEFDPKAADPAKPHLVYQNLMSALEFPECEDGSRIEGFLGFIKQVRDNWDRKNIRSNQILKSSPWFSSAFEILMKHAHIPSRPEYRDACLWLAGNHNSHQAINMLAKEKGLNVRVPRMPVIKETADIYVFHLVVINALCKILGYRGLAIILDEAEHVRGYNVRRRERANNLFDLLSRCAHVPSPEDDEPAYNDHGFSLPKYWEKGPHFGLFVGLTEADTFLDSNLSLRDACVFLRTDDDRIMLINPTREDYKKWCELFLQKFNNHYSSRVPLLDSNEVRNNIAECLAESYPTTSNGIILRNFVKLSSLVPCILMAQPGITVDDLVSSIKMTSGNLFGNELPWE